MAVISSILAIKNEIYEKLLTKQVILIKSQDLI